MRSEGIRPRSRQRFWPLAPYHPQVDPEPTNGMLRPGLELAWAVAKVGSEARPAVPPPGRLRPLMRFAKLADRALSTVRQVVEEDVAFRGRVAVAADEALLGRAPWLWLVRPAGWEEDLGALVKAAGTAALDVQEEKEERTARKRLAAVEGVAVRAEAEVVQLQQLHSEILAELTSERQARRRAETERGELAAALRAAGDQQQQAEQTVLTLRAQISSLADQVADATGQLAATTDQRDAVQAEADRLRARLEAAGSEVAALTDDREQARVTVGQSVARAAFAARLLSEALAEVAQSVAGEEAAGAAGAAPPLSPAGRPGAASPVNLASAPADRPARRAPPARRKPVALPLAVFDDSFEAADFLVRAPGMLLVVDGYNVTISSWPHLELPRQRHHLVNALAELAIRLGPVVHVVFDGTDSGGRFGPPAVARRRMRVTFSPEGVDADEVIVELVEHLDPSQPVVVATDDRRVRDEVSRRGANVISVAQLLAVIGRAPGSVAG
jgi:predicted RNA-binding protein with PIN domain